MKTATIKEKVLIDHPKHDEVITSQEYTFRIQANAAKSVEVSIDEGPWQSCRNSVGYWWFDWRREKSGKHKVVARALSESNKETARHSQTFEVDGATSLSAQELHS